MPEPPVQPELNGCEVVVGVCGGIAAYKVCTVVSRLVQRGCGVTVAMTAAATRFVGPLTFSALTGRAVLDDLWSAPHAGDSQHIRLTDRADLILIAPATANMIGKIAGGIADDVLSTLILAADAPLVLAPSMNERMWAHPAVRANVATLRERGTRVIDPGVGWLACRTVGVGRMAEAETILDTLVSLLSKRTPKSAV